MTDVKCSDSKSAGRLRAPSPSARSSGWWSGALAARPTPTALPRLVGRARRRRRPRWAEGLVLLSRLGSTTVSEGSGGGVAARTRRLALLRSGEYFYLRSRRATRPARTGASATCADVVGAGRVGRGAQPQHAPGQVPVPAQRGLRPRTSSPSPTTSRGSRPIPRSSRRSCAKQDVRGSTSASPRPRTRARRSVRRSSRSRASLRGRDGDRGHARPGRSARDRPGDLRARRCVHGDVADVLRPRNASGDRMDVRVDPRRISVDPPGVRDRRRGRRDGRGLDEWLVPPVEALA